MGPQALRWDAFGCSLFEKSGEIMRTYLTHIAFAIVLTSLLVLSANAQKTVKKDCPGANGLTAAEVTELLALQNHARTGHKLPHLTWDCKLADLAQEWAKRGKFEHRTDTEYGENIYVSSRAQEPAGSAVHNWMLEKAHWTNKTGTCAAGQICTHYTQIVWRKTLKVGCGINRNVSGQWKTLIVCNYDPPGNFPGPAY